MCRLAFARSALACTLGMLLAACAGDVRREQALDASLDAGGPRGLYRGDAGTRSSRDGASVDADAAMGAGDAGARSMACECLHGACDDAGACTCDPRYGGTRCDEPRYVGTGRDGALVVGALTSLATANRPGRTCGEGGDAVSYSVTSIESPTKVRVALTVRSDCVAPGDEVLLINLRGTSTSTVNVGQHEFLEVESASGTLVTFRSKKRRSYGEGAADDTNIGTGTEQQRVVLQRVPHYTNVTVTAQQRLTTSPFDGVRGGVLAFRASGRVIVAGSIDMSRRGYRGGPITSVASTTGKTGESLAGYGVTAQAAFVGAGGGGAGDSLCAAFGAAGGGGGHAEAGRPGTSACAGAGGEVYGKSGLWLLGSGGGAGGTDGTLADNPPGGFGGRGGGVIAIFARELYVLGNIDVGGQPGQGDTAACTDPSSTTACWDWSGPGGGGAGGTIHLEAEKLELGDALVRALGGAGGDGVDGQAGDGGAGGVGRIHVRAGSGKPTGSTDPAATPLD